MLLYNLFKFFAITYDIIDYFVVKPYHDFTDLTLQSKIIRIIKYDLKNLNTTVLYDIPRWRFHYFNFNRLVFADWPILVVDPKIREIANPDSNVIYEIQFFGHNSLYRDIGPVISNQNLIFDEPIFKNTMVLYAGIHYTCDITDFINEYWESFNSSNDMNVLDVLKISYLKNFLPTHVLMQVLSKIIKDDDIKLSLTLNDKTLTEISFKKSDTIIINNV